MKNFQILLFLSFSCFLGAQNIITVGPNSSDYASLQIAIDSATAGDILYVQGGAYGDITLNKSLAIIGPGYFLAENKQTQATKSAANISTLTFDMGSDNTVVEGLLITGNCIVNASNITLKRCRVMGQLNRGNRTDAISNVNILQNYIGVSINVGNSSRPTANLVIKNNFVYGGIALGASAIIENNTIRSISSCASSAPITFKNNIFLNVDGAAFCIGATLTYINNVITNNSVNFQGTAIDNVVGVDANTLFTEEGSSDAMWQLAASSPAIGAGEDGTDCGMFGGDSPYILSGIPTGPHIYEMDVANYGTSQGGLKVIIKAKLSN